MFLHDIMDVGALERLIAARYIIRHRSADGRLAIYDYSANATWDRCWTPETRACRGLVVDVASGAVLAHPFDKLWSVNEPGMPETQPAALLERAGLVELTEKLDGSMVAFWYDLGTARWRCSTRLRFDNAQVRGAHAWAEERTGFRDWPEGYTMIAEWRAPENRVVLRHDTADLRLIGARRPDGVDVGYAELVDLAHVVALPVVDALADGDLRSVFARQAEERGIEGWVARWPDAFRVKIKTADYLRLHRLIMLFSPERVRDAMLTGDAERYLRELPEELRAEAEAIQQAITTAVAARVRQVRATYARLRPRLEAGRRAYAEAVRQEPEADRGLLFALADGQALEQRVLKAVDLAALFDPPAGDQAPAPAGGQGRERSLDAP